MNFFLKLILELLKVLLLFQFLFTYNGHNNYSLHQMLRVFDFSPFINFIVFIETLLFHIFIYCYLYVSIKLRTLYSISPCCLVFKINKNQFKK